MLKLKSQQKKYRIKYLLIITFGAIILSSLYQRSFILYVTSSGCDFGTCAEQVGSGGGPIVFRTIGFPLSYYGIGYFNHSGQRVTTYDANCISGDCVAIPNNITPHKPSVQPKPVPIADSEVQNTTADDIGFNLDQFLIDVIFWFIISGIFYVLCRPVLNKANKQVI